MSSVHPKLVQEMARPNKERLIEEAEDIRIPIENSEDTSNWAKIKKWLIRAGILILVCVILYLFWTAINFFVLHPNQTDQAVRNQSMTNDISVIEKAPAVAFDQLWKSSEVNELAEGDPAPDVDADSVY